MSALFMDEDFLPLFGAEGTPLDARPGTDERGTATTACLRAASKAHVFFRTDIAPTSSRQ